MDVLHSKLVCATYGLYLREDSHRIDYSYVILAYLRIRDMLLQCVQDPLASGFVVELIAELL